MSHRSMARGRCASAAAALVVASFLWPATVGAVPADRSQEPPDTLLPPADDEDVSIVPTDRQQAPAAEDTERNGETPVVGANRLADDEDAGPDGPVAATLLVLLALGVTALAVARVRRMLYAWRSPISLAAASFGPAGPPSSSFTLLVPARRSGKLLGPTLDALAAIDHPDVEILAVVPYDDAEARGATLAAALRHPGQVHLVVDKSFRKARAAGLNAALTEAQGEIVGVVEPGDRLHPRLLRHVDGCFADPDVAAVQGGVELVAAKRRWFGARHAVERYFWSRSRLHVHASQRFTPMEGSTAFVRREVLRSSGGWDEACDAEGCELGVRLSTEGRQIVVAYSPELATQKPAVAGTAALFAERVRWMGGFVRVLRKGWWRRLPTRSQRMRAALALARPLADAVAGVAVPVAVVAALVLPLRPAYVLLLLLPAVPALVAIGVEAVALSEIGRIRDRPRRRRDQVWLVVSSVPYQLLEAAAAARALLGELRHDRGPAPIAVAKAARSRSANGRQRQRLENIDELDKIDLTAPHVFDDPSRPALPQRLELPAAATTGER